MDDSVDFRAESVPLLKAVRVAHFARAERDETAVAIAAAADGERLRADIEADVDELGAAASEFRAFLGDVGLSGEEAGRVERRVAELLAERHGVRGSVRVSPSCTLLAFRLPAWMHTSVSLSLSLCVYVGRPVCLPASVSLSVSLLVCLPGCLSVSESFGLSSWMPVCQ